MNRLPITIACILPVIIACNPCEVEFAGDTAIIASRCPIATTEDHTSGSDDSESNTTMGPETDGPDSETGGPDDQPPTCIAVPQAGEAWGQCHVGKICDPGLTCNDLGAGNVCVPGCTDDACPGFKCFGGTCDASDLCVYACEANEDCGIPGTFCFQNQCVYPAFAP